MHKYRINYVGRNNELLSFEVEASNWEELKLKIDEKLPNDVKYLAGIHYIRTFYTEADLR